MSAFKVAVTTKEVFVEIELLKKHGFSLRQIAKEVDCAVNTVRRQLAAGDMPKYVHKAPRPTKLGTYEAYLRARQESPGCQNCCCVQFLIRSTLCSLAHRIAAMSQVRDV